MHKLLEEHTKLSQKREKNPNALIMEKKTTELNDSQMDEVKGSEVDDRDSYLD